MGQLTEPSFFASSPLLHPLSSGWSFRCSFPYRQASWLELGSQVSFTDRYLLLPIQHGKDWPEFKSLWMRKKHPKNSMTSCCFMNWKLKLWPTKLLPPLVSFHVQFQLQPKDFLQSCLLWLFILWDRKSWTEKNQFQHFCRNSFCLNCLFFLSIPFAPLSSFFLCKRSFVS